MNDYQNLQKQCSVMNTHVPTPSFSQDQLVASLAASLLLPPASPTRTPEQSEADPRPQISSSVNISLVFSTRQESLWGKKTHHIMSPEKQLKFLNTIKLLVCVYMLLILYWEISSTIVEIRLCMRSVHCVWLMPSCSISVSRFPSPLHF